MGSRFYYCMSVTGCAVVQLRDNWLHPPVFLVEDVRHSAVIRGSVIKGENPEMRIHNAIPCDLVFTGTAMNVCLSVCVRVYVHTCLCCSICVHGVCPKCCLTLMCHTLALRFPNAFSILGIFFQVSAVGWGRRVIYRSGEASSASRFTSGFKVLHVSCNHTWLPYVLLPLLLCD